jgi:hypothetical protein
MTARRLGFYLGWYIGAPLCWPFVRLALLVPLCRRRLESWAHSETKVAPDLAAFLKGRTP